MPSHISARATYTILATEFLNAPPPPKKKSQYNWCVTVDCKPFAHGSKLTSFAPTGNQSGGCWRESHIFTFHWTISMSDSAVSFTSYMLKKYIRYFVLYTYRVHHLHFDTLLNWHVQHSCEFLHVYTAPVFFFCRMQCVFLCPVFERLFPPADIICWEGGWLR